MKIRVCVCVLLWPCPVCDEERENFTCFSDNILPLSIERFTQFSLAQDLEGAQGP